MRRWRAHRGIYFIRIPEVLFTVAMLVLTTRSAPDVWRTDFWQIGFDNGLNSSPSIILYALANNRKAKVPFVWSQTWVALHKRLQSLCHASRPLIRISFSHSLTDYNSALAILSLFIWLTSLVATIMNIFLPVIGLFISLSMTALYTASIVGQAGPDHADPAHPSPSPWYLRKGCGLAAANGRAGDCHKAQAQFAFTILLLYVLALLSFLCGPSPLKPSHSYFFFLFFFSYLYAGEAEGEGMGGVQASSLAAIFISLLKAGHPRTGS